MNTKTTKSALAIGLTAVTLSSSVFAQNNLNTSTTSLPTAPVQKIDSMQDVLVEPSFILLPRLSGITLAPGAGQLQFDGSFAIGNVEPTKSTNSNSDYKPKTEQQNVQLAYGLSGGLFLAFQANHIKLNAETGKSSSTTDGFTEPMIGVGYKTKILSDETLVTSLSYALSTGDSESNSNYSDQTSSYSNSSNGKAGGSSIIPSIQLSSKRVPGLTFGGRISYAIEQDKSSVYNSTSTSSSGITTSSTTKYTDKGGNSLIAVAFASAELSSSTSIGGSLASIGKEKTTSERQEDGHKSEGNYFGYRIISVNLPIKVSANAQIIPQISHGQSTNGDDGISSNDLSVTGRFAF